MLTQAEADALIVLGKQFVGAGPTGFPPGTDDTHEVESQDGRERFLLDMSRSSFRLSKMKLQSRTQKVIVLVRLCIEGPLHTNPDGVRMPKTHLHLYREGYEDKFAFAIPAEFQDISSPERVFYDFLDYCRIVRPPEFQAPLALA